MKSWRNLWPAIWLLLILSLVAVVRVRMFSVPLERDEGEYAYAGQLILQGEPPYRLIYNMKMPGIYAGYALIMALFGQSASGIRLGFMLVNFGAIVLLFFVGRRFLSPAGAVAAAAAYAFLSLSPHVLGFNAHATHFVALAALGATLALLRARERDRLMGFFWSGVLFGVAFLMKQPGGAFAFFGSALILWWAWNREPRQWKQAVLRLAVFSAGVVAPITLTGLILWWAGVWDRFWWWTVTYARVHATALSWQYGKSFLNDFFFGAPHWDMVFWALALAGWLFVLFARRNADEKFFFSSWLLFSAASVVPTFNFTNHYFVLMLPVVALLAARAFAQLAVWTAAQPLALVRMSPWILFALVLTGVALTYRGPLVGWNAQQATARMYPNNQFQVYPVIADYLAKHSPPTATLAVLGSEPQLLFYAHRRSVTGYVYMYDLVQEQPFRERMEKEMISEVERGKPDFVVFANVLYSWMPRPLDCFDSLKAWLMKYTDACYEPFGLVTFSPGPDTPNQYFWGSDCLEGVPLGHRFVVVFKRRAAASLPAPAGPAPL